MPGSTTPSCSDHSPSGATVRDRVRRRIKGHHGEVSSDRVTKRIEYIAKHKCQYGKRNDSQDSDDQFAT